MCGLLLAVSEVVISCDFAENNITIFVITKRDITENVIIWSCFYFAVMVESGWAEWVLTGSARILVLRKCRDFSVLRFSGMDFEAFLVGEIHQLTS